LTGGPPPDSQHPGSL